ncbi:MAG: 4-(cytidine 5'-diphospho)-2-C-methyl-D-erythritol kinase [Oscillatoriales cyanobacterium SM2_2_1]|nr:4-(cytidine 5'-diphospho)-2-C-methyl-D-erythritol kinase [Oscillatoriales cyanobacterium SM2_2_1]
MRSLSLTAAAKVNLYLEITGDRADGYHELVMVLQSIDLRDRVTLRLRSDDQITLDVLPNGMVPADASNLAYRAARALFDRTPNVGGVHITLEKHIPVGAGLAGGSTDGAAVLVGLNQLWELGLSQTDLCGLAAQLGSDVPFCLLGGTVLATGRGEVLSPLPNVVPVALVLAKPRSLSVSTVWAYQTFRAERLLATSPKQGQRYSQNLLRALNQQAAAAEWAPWLYNDLERVVLPHYRAIADLKAALQSPPPDLQPLQVLMSGSGAAVFALCNGRPQAHALREFLIQTQPEVEAWVVHSQGHSIELD